MADENGSSRWNGNYGTDESRRRSNYDMSLETRATNRNRPPGNTPYRTTGKAPIAKKPAEKFFSTRSGETADD